VKLFASISFVLEMVVKFISPTDDEPYFINTPLSFLTATIESFVCGFALEFVCVVIIGFVLKNEISISTRLFKERLRSELFCVAGFVSPKLLSLILDLSTLCDVK